MGNFDLVVSDSCHSEVQNSTQIQMDLMAVLKPEKSSDLAETLAGLCAPNGWMLELVELAWVVCEYS